MKRTVTAVTILLVAAAWYVPEQKTLFSSLKVGQHIAVKDLGTAFEISVFGESPLTHTVTEIGSNFIVVKDNADVLERRIPVYSIRSVVHIKAGK